MSAASGWYPDPGGQPLMYRYWDGTTWSQELSTNPASPPPGTPMPVVTPYAATSYAPRKSGTRWFLAAGALLVVVVIVIVLVVRGVTDGVPVTGPTPGGPPSADVCPTTPTPSATPDPQSGNRVTSGKLSYPRLGEPFREPYPDYRVPFGRDVRSQDAVVEVGGEGRPTWVASVLIARLLAGDGFFGPEQGAKVVAACAIGRFYGDGVVQRDDKRSEATTVDGHPAWIIESHLSFQLPDVKTTGETMLMVVVDTGDGEAGLFYGSIPDTSPQFMKPMRASLAALQVAD